jgi:PKD repeat protein
VLIGLPERDPSGFSAYEAAVYTPGTGAFHQFLSPNAISSRYGASSANVAGVGSYFESYGLTVTPSPDGLLLTVQGTSGAQSLAFGTSFDQYRGADGRSFFSHPTPAHLPAALGISGVVGLGDVSPLVPLGLAPGPSAPSAPVTRPTTTCSQGSSGLSPCQIWGAYDMAGLIANGTNGAGKRIGVVDTYDSAEPQSQLASDLSSFDSTFGLAAPTVNYNYPVPTATDLNTSSSSSWGFEEALDLQWTHATAPGASIAMTFAPNSGVGLYEAVDWLVSHQLVDVISLSWGEPDVGVYNAVNGACALQCNASTDGSYEILGPVLKAAAVEGISVFVASGDCGSADGTSGVATDYPSSDPSATGVGGTILSVDPMGVYQSEVAWSGNTTGASSPGCQNQGGSGGGFSPFPRPYWQSGTGVPTPALGRGDPDVSADAATPVEIFYGGGAGGVGGTSLATPIWAGITAVSDQYAGHDLGFLNPAVYSILRGSNYATDFHDILSGSNGYSAGTGWDPITGVGTPIVANMVRDIATPNLPASSLTARLSASAVVGSAPLTVQFSIASSGGAAPYPLQDVYFGDGNAAVASSGLTSHVFARAGVYAATAFVADSTGNLTVSEPVAIVVGGGISLTVTLTPSASTAPVGTPLTFSTTVVGGTAPFEYAFSFGDGTFLNLSASSSATHSYGAAGSYCADLVVQDSGVPIDGGRSVPVPIAVGGAGAPVCSSVTPPLKVTAEVAPAVRDAPADFPLFNVSAPAGLPYLFNITGGNSGVNGSAYTETYASSDPYVAACSCALFRSPGTYSITLGVSDGSGNRSSNMTNVTVAPTLTAAFTTTAPYGPAPLTVSFSATVAGGHLPNVAFTKWAFGDGTYTVGASVSHTYTTPGFYSATGDAWDQGRGNASEGFLIDVLPTSGSPSPALTATFAPAVNVSSGSTIHFVAHSNFSNGAPAPVVFHWHTRQASTAYGSVADQSYYVAAAHGARRNLEVNLTATWGGATPNVTASLLSPQFFAYQLNGAFKPRYDALYLYQYTNRSLGPLGVKWYANATALFAAGTATAATGTVHWNFGDGGTATGAAVTHIFQTAGGYSITLSANDSWGDVARGVLGLLVGAPVTPPLSVLGGPSVQTGTAPLTVSFAANVTGGALPYTFSWSTGDGGTATAENFSYLYQSSGNFTATLLVFDSHGNKYNKSWTIDVLSGGSANTTGSGAIPPLVLYVILAGVIAAIAVVAVVLLSGRRRPPPPTPSRPPTGPTGPPVA